MKIRKGFVSNSSSSSFVAWGVEADRIKYKEQFYLNIFNDSLKWYETAIGTSTDSEELITLKSEYEQMCAMQTSDEKIDYAENNCDIEYGKEEIINSGFEGEYIGIPVSWLTENAPELKFKEVKDFVAGRLNKVYGTSFTEEDIEYFEESWYG